MKKSILIILLLSVFSTSVFAQKEFYVDGVLLPRTIDFQTKTLELNGYGTRSKMWFDVYVQALYLTKLSQDPVEILESQYEMGIRIQITSKLVSSQKFSKSVKNGFEKSVGPENLPRYKDRLLELENIINKEKIVENDIFKMVYNPKDLSLWFYKNDVYKGKVTGVDFKKAFFGIWLSDNPINEKLKNDLLGK